MTDYVIVGAAALLMAGLLYGERVKNASLILPFKAPLSVLFVVFAVVQPHPVPEYYALVLVGLILGLVGDVCLAVPGQASFRIGVIAFLLGHVLYIVAFGRLTPLREWARPESLIVLFVSAGAFVWLRSHAGSMLGLVILYIAVITAMLVGAAAVAGKETFSPTFRLAVGVGACAFYVSDLFVARERFIHSQFVNRLIGLPLYYAGQFLIAFSVGLPA
jgi:uncharacterized membrane protein YhhN